MHLSLISFCLWTWLFVWCIWFKVLKIKRYRLAILLIYRTQGWLYARKCKWTLFPHITSIITWLLKSISLSPKNIDPLLLFIVFFSPCESDDKFPDTKTGVVIDVATPRAYSNNKVLAYQTHCDTVLCNNILVTVTKRSDGNFSSRNLVIWSHVSLWDTTQLKNIVKFLSNSGIQKLNKNICTWKTNA